MINKSKILCALLAFSAAFAVSACGKNDNDSSAADNVDDASSVVTSKADKDTADASNVGPYLKKAAEIYKSGKYTLKCTVTSTADDGAIKLTRVVNGDDVYQLQQEKKGSYGIISMAGKTYAFDNACGMYKTAKSVPSNNVVEEVVDRNLMQTKSYETEEQGFVTEQYTFTGETFITNVKFYFDEQTGDLKKYVMKYTVEGQEDITETRVIDSISKTVDDSVFSLDFLDKMVNFENMTEDQRLGFCQGICSSKGITAEMMSNMGIKADNFKTIDFDAFFNLVYSYSNN